MRLPLDVMRLRRFQFSRYDPMSNTFGMVRNGGTRAHQGWDLEAPVGTRVYAISDGYLTTGYSPGGYGRWARLRFHHHGKTLYAFYGHLEHHHVHGHVTEGTVVGRSGRSGNATSIPATESHLHFEIRTVPHPGKGLGGRIDPAVILGYRFYECKSEGVMHEDLGW